MSNIESSRVSDEEDTLSMSTENPESLAQSSMAADSMIATSDIVDSSMINSTMTEANSRRNKSAKQNGPRFYHKKRFWAMCLAINVVLSAIFIPLLFLVIIPAVAQDAINKSKLDIQVINITKATNTSFSMSMLGAASKAGPVSAKIEFNGPVHIFYNNKEIGSADMESLSVSGGQGVVKGNDKVFNIEDQETFNDFASTSLKVKTFKWSLRGSAKVHTLGMTINNLKLSKDLDIPGSNGFITNVISLNVTQNGDTLNLEVLTSIYNPSPIAIELGDMYLQLIYNGTTIADAVAKGVFLQNKENNLTLIGTAAIPTTEAAKYNYLKIMDGYLTNTPVNTSAKVTKVISPSGDRVGWINEAVSSLDLYTTVGNQITTPQFITNIDFGEMSLKFTPDAPWAPTVSATNANAVLNLPFHIDYEIIAASQNITLYAKGKPVAMINTPESNVSMTSTGISLNITETQMKVVDNDAFSDFLVGFTATSGTNVDIAGTSSVVVNSFLGNNTPIDGMPFKLTTFFQGFNQFNSDGSPPAVSNISILAGDSNPNQLVMGLVVTLINPAKYSFSGGSVTLDMFYKEIKVGTAFIQDLSVVPGPNPIAIVATLFNPDQDPVKEIVIAGLTGQSVEVSIRGSDNSTNIASLVKAFKAINITSTIPPLGLSLVKNSKLVIDNQTAATMGVIDMTNDFLAPVSIYTMNSTFSYNGTVIGTVEQDIRNNPIFIQANSDSQFEIPVKMVTDPVTTFSMVRNLAIQNGLDVSVLDSLITLGKVNVPGVDPNVQPTPEAIKSFDIVNFTTAAMGKIPVTVNMDSRIAIGECFLSISYKQNIISETDASTVAKLIPTFAQPMIQPMMEQTQLSFNSVFIKNIDVSSFDVFTDGQVTNAGPIPGVINFPSGVNLTVGNVLLGTLVNVSPVVVDPVAGAKLNGANASRFQIADIPTFTTFIGNMMGSAGSVEGEISSEITINSFGTLLGPISMSKPIELNGFNNLQEFTLSNLSFPYPNFSAKVAFSNPTPNGIELGTVAFNILFGSELVAKAVGDNVVIVPNGESIIDFQGQIGLSVQEFSTAFSALVSKTVPLVVQGVAVQPPKATGEVEWLTNSFQKFTISVPFDITKLIKPPAAAGAPAAPSK